MLFRSKNEVVTLTPKFGTAAGSLKSVDLSGVVLDKTKTDAVDCEDLFNSTTPWDDGTPTLTTVDSISATYAVKTADGAVDDGRTSISYRDNGCTLIVTAVAKDDAGNVLATETLELPISLG